MATSGVGNILVYGMDNNWEGSGREYAQKFVSGALAAYSGVSTFGKVDYLKMADGKGGKKYFGGSKETAKAWRAGWLNQASDFAHSSEESFKKRNLRERALMFVVAASASEMGSEGEKLITGIEGNAMFGLAKGFIYAASGYYQYHMQQIVHHNFSKDSSYLPWNYKYRSTKLSVAGYKALFYGLSLR